MPKYSNSFLGRPPTRGKQNGIIRAVEALKRYQIFLDAIPTDSFMSVGIASKVQKTLRKGENV
jgi:hypothetical protein